MPKKENKDCFVIMPISDADGYPIKKVALLECSVPKNLTVPKRQRKAVVRVRKIA